MNLFGKCLSKFQFSLIGADLKERSTMKEEEIGPHVTRYRKLFDDLSKISVPVIAALDGAALGKEPLFVLHYINSKLQILYDFFYF